ILLTDGATLALAPLSAEVCVRVDERAGDEAGAGGEDLGLAIDPESLAYLIYTSGSEGRPKGVAVTHRGVTNLTAYLEQALPGRHGRILQSMSWAFDASVWRVLTALAQEATLQLMGSVRLLPGPELADLIE